MRRALVAAGLVIATTLVTATPASAHTGQVAATDYQARVARTAGLDVHLVEAGGRVELTWRSGPELVVLGYEDEPYLRVGPDGVFENRRSPATYLNASRTGGEQPPASATADAQPRWARVSTGQTARWHDHRLHWMSQAPPAVRRDPGARHTVTRWDIPVRQGDRTRHVQGAIVYVPGPPVWPWLVLAGLVAFLVAALGRRRGPLLVALGLLVAVDVVRVAGLSLVVAGTAGDRLRQAADVGALDLVGWGLAAGAVVRLVAGKPDGRVAAGLAGVLLAVAGGVLEWGDLGRSQLAVSTPDAVARTCVALVAGLALGVAASVLRDAYLPTRAATRRAR